MVSSEKAEELVRRLPQVTGCRIRADEHGNPVAVMVTARPGSNPAAVRADVITVLGAQARLDVLEEQIHVAVLEAPPAEPEPLVAVEEIESEGRARLVSFRTSVSEERSRAEVELAHDGRNVRGQAESHGAGESPELLARACLDAVEKLCHGRVALRLAGFHRTVVGTTEVVCVLVQETRGRSERVLVGAVRAGSDPARAAASAALDSLNRRLGRILVGPPVDYEIG